MQVGQDEGVSDGTQFGAQPGPTAPLQVLVAPVGKARMATLVALMFAVGQGAFPGGTTGADGDEQRNVASCSSDAKRACSAGSFSRKVWMKISCNN